MAIRPKFHRPRKPVRMADKAERDRFYGSAYWARVRLAYLAEHPVCAECKRKDATIVHHVKERLDRPDLQYDWANLQGLCSPCHTRAHKVKV